mmetsp:Transcript_21533/g.54267  ORF Transcript_21533/g.54267 Transcript_21533/m.54267 type:complete len:523 (-) Transcript_21533:927-2495(-)
MSMASFPLSARSQSTWARSRAFLDLRWFSGPSGNARSPTTVPASSTSSARGFANVSNRSRSTKPVSFRDCINTPLLKISSQGVHCTWYLCASSFTNLLSLMSAPRSAMSTMAKSIRLSNFFAQACATCITFSACFDCGSQGAWKHTTYILALLASTAGSSSSCSSVFTVLGKNQRLGPSSIPLLAFSLLSPPSMSFPLIFLMPTLLVSPVVSLVIVAMRVSVGFFFSTIFARSRSTAYSMRPFVSFRVRFSKVWSRPSAGAAPVTCANRSLIVPNRCFPVIGSMLGCDCVAFNCFGLLAEDGNAETIESCICLSWREVASRIPAVCSFTSEACCTGSACAIVFIRSSESPALLGSNRDGGTIPSTKVCFTFSDWKSQQIIPVVCGWFPSTPVLPGPFASSAGCFAKRLWHTRRPTFVRPPPAVATGMATFAKLASSTPSVHLTFSTPVTVPVSATRFVRATPSRVTARRYTKPASSGSDSTRPRPHSLMDPSTSPVFGPKNMPEKRRAFWTWLTTTARLPDG